MDKNLQRLIFSVMVRVGEGIVHNAPEPAEFAFIYGIGTDGLSDFEMAIDGLGVGETHRLEMQRSKLAAHFGWLYGHFHKTLGLPNIDSPLLMEFTLQEVFSPEPREIVSAIAELQAHGGCGTDCGCGCH